MPESASHDVPERLPSWRGRRRAFSVWVSQMTLDTHTPVLRRELRLAFRIGIWRYHWKTLLAGGALAAFTVLAL